jgi:hypothetical protein
MKNIPLFMAIGLASSLAMVQSCKKKTPTVEKPKGVVMCKVNGVNWQSGDAATIIDISGNKYYKTSATLRNDSLWITGIRNQTDTSGIYIYSLKLLPGSIGKVTGTTDAYRGAMYLPKYDLNSLIATLGKYNVTYEVNIDSKDAANKTISGTFIINMVSGKGNILIESGEFIELKYK